MPFGKRNHANKFEQKQHTHTLTKLQQLTALKSLNCTIREKAIAKVIQQDFLSDIVSFLY